MHCECTLTNRSWQKFLEIFTMVCFIMTSQFWDVKLKLLLLLLLLQKCLLGESNEETVARKTAQEDQYGGARMPTLCVPLLMMIAELEMSLFSFPLYNAPVEKGEAMLAI